MANKTIIVAGYGPGISNSVAEKFGAEGFSVALVARNADRLAAGVKSLEAKGIKAAAFPTDLADLKATRALIGKARAALGPITILHWNGYPEVKTAGDFLTASDDDLHKVMDVALGSMIAGLQESLADMRANKNEAALLVTNGGLGYYEQPLNEMAVQWGAMGLGLANAAKHKTVGMLSAKLKPEGIYVGEVMVLASVKGTAFDDGSGAATLEASAVAEKLWSIYKERGEVFATIK